MVRVIRTAGNSPRGYIPQASEEPDAGEVDAWMLSMGSKDHGRSSNGIVADPVGTSPSNDSLGRGEASAGSGLGVRRQPQYRSEWKEVRCNHPLPPFGISSPGEWHECQHRQWTRADNKLLCGVCSYFADTNYACSCSDPPLASERHYNPCARRVSQGVAGARRQPGLPEEGPGHVRGVQGR